MIAEHPRNPASGAPYARVPYNDWWRLDVPPLDAFRPSAPVSVVVPYHESPAELGRLLAALEAQTYPRALFEVVVVDDGSPSPPPVPPGCPLQVRVVRQERRGFGLARARNAGARAARHGILVFLDGDMIPDAPMLAAHARWHHAVADALTLGFRARLDGPPPDAAAVREHGADLKARFGTAEYDARRALRLRRLDDLAAHDDGLFQAVLGCNFAMTRDFYLGLGGCNESFARYGFEDVELGWRVHARGGLLVPERAALSWHPDVGEGDLARKDADMAAQWPEAAGLIPHDDFRPSAAAIHPVPRHVVALAVGDTAARTAETVERLLGDPQGDLVVRVEMPARHAPEDVEWLAARFRADPRVVVAPDRDALDEHPDAPFHVAAPACGRLPADLVAQLRAGLGTAAMATADLPGGGAATIARSWALHRARRARAAPDAFGASVRVRLGTRAPAPAPPRPRAPRRWRDDAALLAAELREVRGPRTALAALRFAGGRLRRRLLAPPPVPASAAAAATEALGLEISTAGPRAAAVFAASDRVGPASAGRRADAVLADTPADTPPHGFVAVALADHPALAVPAFDPRRHNPVGWRRVADRRTAALGPAHLLPTGLRLPLRTASGDRAGLRRAHHLVDTAAFHRDAATRAGTLLRIAADGVPIRLVDRDPALEALLGAELHARMADEPGSLEARERASIHARRAALRDHTLAARARQVAAAAGLPCPPALPRITILLATRRPALLGWALDNVARQNYPDLELVLALHGAGFAAMPDEALRGRLRMPVRVLRVPAEQSLGTVLNAATDAATGQLIAKMDDDDLYGADAVYDVFLAHAYSGATLVGKSIETVYLAGRDETLRVRHGAAETYADEVAGGTLLVARRDLDRAGGWRRVPSGVDRALVEDVRRADGSVYRTHGAGFALVRHGLGHTWRAGDEELLGLARERHAGWRPALADMPGHRPPPVR